MSLDPAIPRLVPEGHYVLELSAEPTKETSQFGGFYYRINFIAKDETGQHYEFADCFNQKMDRYHDLLRALGGQTQSNGITIPPNASLVGMKIEGDIQHRQAKNDKTKTIDEVINIRPYGPEPSEAQVEVAKPSNEGAGDEVPF